MGIRIMSGDNGESNGKEHRQMHLHWIICSPRYTAVLEVIEFGVQGLGG